MTRTFDDRPAVREQTPVLVGLVGPSGSGKTYSALRIASGIQAVSGGDIYGIDTEARRMLAYADKFKFRHVPFGAPFSPADYLDVFNHCVKKGAKTIVVDSMSHEHEGPGGVLEMHEKEMGGNFKKQMIAWAKPKAERRKLINAILQVPANFVFCFRAKEKLKIVPGKDPEPRGFMAIGGEEWIYEMTVSMLLLPNANGVPTWQSQETGERLTIKLPEQFKSIFAAGGQLTEAMGSSMAKWAAGESLSATAPANDAPVAVPELLARFEACADAATLRTLRATLDGIWKQLSKAERDKLGAAGKAAVTRIEAANAAPPDPAPETADEDDLPIPPAPDADPIAAAGGMT